MINKNLGKLENKFKDRTPEDTVNVIKNIFYNLDKNFNFKERLGETGVNIYWYSVYLYYNDVFVADVAGKGMTKEFARASAFGELYERFSCEINESGYLNWMNAWKENPEIKFSLDQKEISFDEEFKYFPEKENLKEKEKIQFSLLYESENVIGAPFKDLIYNKNDIYLDMRHLFTLDGSHGMAAGNSLIEALNQAISELGERYVQFGLVKNVFKLREIDRKIIEQEAPLVYKEMINIEKLGYKVISYDSSESTGLPVVMSVLIDYNTKQMFLKFGSFPIFNIAIERTITEVLQGKDLFDKSFMVPCLPAVNACENNDINIFCDGTGYYPEDIFITKDIMKEINYNIFLKPDSSNEQIFNHWIKLYKKMNVNIYWRNMSFSNDMFAVWTYSPELLKFIPRRITGNYKEEDFKNIDILIKHIKENDFTIHSIMNCIKYVDKCFVFKSIDIYLFINFIQERIGSSIAYYIKSILEYSIYNFDNACREINKIDVREFNGKIEPLIFSIYINYKCSNKYTDDEIKQIFDYWKIDEEYYNAIVNNDENFREMFLKNVFFGDTYRKNIETTVCIKNKINNARKKIMEEING